MAVALVPVADPLPDGLYHDAAGRLLAAAFDLWAADAGRWLKLGDDVPARDRARCEDAWELIVRRPAGCPLVDLAAQLAGVDELTIWRWLRQRSVAAELG